MRLTSKLFGRSAAGLAAAIAVAVPVMAGTASAAPTANLLRNVAYYTTGATGTPFCRSTAPTTVTLTAGGTASQARNHAGNGPVTLSITGAPTYATDGFYETVGTLGDLAGYSVHAHGTIGDNLWLDTNTTNDVTGNGPYFTWTGTCLTSLGGDKYGLGPSSTPTGHGQSVLTVTGSSTFFLIGGCEHTSTVTYTVTLGQLEDGYCTGIGPTTETALWLGITAPTGRTLSATITSAQLTP